MTYPPAYEVVPSAVPVLKQDRFLAPDLVLAEELVSSGKILAAVEAQIGELE